MCNCNGLCDSFKSMDFNALPFQVESDVDEAYASLHPQACGEGDKPFQADGMKSPDADTYIPGGAARQAKQEDFREDTVEG